MSGAMSREERRRASELEEARKAGLAPAERDEDGNEINPHIPQFMAAAPWYLSQKPGLKHQKAWREVDDGAGADGGWYKRGVKTFQASKFRKGACENCGAMTHKRKDCVERPRRVGANKSGTDIAADEHVQRDVQLGFEQKRDRYNGFDASDYGRVVDKFEAAEQLKEEVAKKRELEKTFNPEGGKETNETSAGAENSDSDSESDGEKAEDKDAQGFMKVTKRVSTAGGGASMTVRNLRIREDTAKYLRNLDLGSAYYDPKTRSMRENPTPNGNPSDDFVAASGGGGGGGSHISVFLGDNVNRGTGDAVGFERLMGHASDAFDAGAEVHANANPSAAELMYKQFREKKKAATIHTKGSILDKYGDASEQTKAPEGLLLGQTETYTEYDQAGRALRGDEVVAQKSRYDEDVFDGNHTSVWGSFWHRGLWGYACCRSVQKGAYCTGSKGIAASLAANDLMLQNLEMRRAAKEKEAEETAALEAAGAGTSFGKSGMKNPFGEGASKWGDKDETAQDVELDPAKLMEALRKEDKRLKGDDADADDEISDKKKRGNKRGYNVLADEKEPTEEEMEAFRMKRTREEDPMAAKDAGTGGYDLV